MDRDKFVAAMRQEMQEIHALQLMLKNLRNSEERGYTDADQRRVDAIANLYAASNETLMSSYYKLKDEQDC